MADAIFVVLTVFFIAASLAFVEGIDRL